MFCLEKFIVNNIIDFLANNGEIVCSWLFNLFYIFYIKLNSYDITKILNQLSFY